MRIYRMTATFGKLEHETLTLEPGLNIITAPNEWGKSTWCAFLVAMLYGLDTRAKTTKTVLADKERYAPWSGSPMAGRIDLCWNGRDITIERGSKGRVPLGVFRAYETESGLEIPQLTKDNCGQLLLGVEQSVFRRAGFIRHGDLPVTQDEALRRRLNALVTTGDESGNGDKLAEELKNLKNRCQANRTTGLIPQVKARKEELEEKLRELDSLDGQLKALKTRQGEVKAWQLSLENHRTALEAAAAEADAGRVAQAREARDLAENHLMALENICAKLPSREEAEKKERELRAFREEWNAIALEQQYLPRSPLPPAQKPPFIGMDVPAALEMVRRDRKCYEQTVGSKKARLLYGLGALCFLGAVALLVAGRYLFTAALAGGAALILLAALLLRTKQLNRGKELEKKYGTSDPARWAEGLREYEAQLQAFTQAQEAYTQAQEDVDVRLMVLRKRKESLCGAQEPDAMLEYWQQTLSKWTAWEAARREARQAQDHFDTLSAMAKTAKTPVLPDHLTYSREQTETLLAEAAGEEQRLHSRMGQYRGRMEALGDRSALEAQLTAAAARIEKLEQTYTALTIAQEALNQARAELQRRFAPKIAQRAQELMARMTDGRYQKLTMGEHFDLQAGTQTEDVLHDAIWRSDGTIDQLYLTLRLAVARELMPEAPVILDDALVCFDDRRLRRAVELLREEAEDKQVILFTCQSREGKE